MASFASGKDLLSASLAPTSAVPATTLVDYFGPNVGAGAASKANAVMWMDANGSAYFGGQLSAGILRNAVQTTTTQTVGVELVNGPFATNGRVRSVTVSFSRRHVRTKTTYGTDGFVAGGGQNTARVEIYRRVGEGAGIVVASPQRQRRGEHPQ
ncbi:hypothetical protein ACE0DR_28655 [Azotobacter sp. CWF10]